jgi:hypothetical protein
MPTPRLEVPSGAVNGTNQAFTTSVPYTAGTLSVWINGQLKRQDLEDGWAETSPTTGVFTMGVAPKTGDIIQVFFLDRTPALATSLTGVIETVVRLTGGP